MSVNGGHRPIGRWDGAEERRQSRARAWRHGARYSDDDDPLGAARGIFNGLVMGMVFWVLLGLVIWLVFLKS